MGLYFRKRKTTSSQSIENRFGEQGSAKTSVIAAILLVVAGAAFAAYFLIGGSADSKREAQPAGKSQAQHAEKARQDSKAPSKPKASEQASNVTASGKQKELHADCADAAVVTSKNPANSKQANASVKLAVNHNDKAIDSKQNPALEYMVLHREHPQKLNPGKKGGSASGKQNVTAIHRKPESFDAMIARARQSLFTVFNITGYQSLNGKDETYTALQGSAFLYNSNGLLVTNGHVVENNTHVVVVGTDGKEYAGKVIGFSYNPDLALIQVPKLNGKKAFPLDKVKGYRVGTEVAAIADNLNVTLTRGQILEKNLNIKVDPEDPYYYPKMYITDAATPPGFSGGPLISVKSKKIIGINSLHNMENDILGYSIPFHIVNEKLKSWSKKPMSEKEIFAMYQSSTVVQPDKKKTADTAKKPAAPAATEKTGSKTQIKVPDQKLPQQNSLDAAAPAEADKTEAPVLPEAAETEEAPAQDQSPVKDEQHVNAAKAEEGALSPSKEETPAVPSVQPASEKADGEPAAEDLNEQ